MLSVVASVPLAIVVSVLDNLDLVAARIQVRISDTSVSGENVFPQNIAFVVE